MNGGGLCGVIQCTCSDHATHPHTHCAVQWVVHSHSICMAILDMQSYLKIIHVHRTHCPYPYNNVCTLLSALTIVYCDA